MWPGQFFKEPLRSPFSPFLKGEISVAAFEEGEIQEKVKMLFKERKCYKGVSS